MTGFRGNFPPESHCGRPGHGGFDPIGLTVEQGPALRRVEPVVVDCTLAQPGRIPTGAPQQTRRVQRFGKRDDRNDRQRCVRADGPTIGISHDDPVSSLLRRLDVQQSQGRRGGAADSIAFRQIQPIELPLIAQRRGAAGGNTEGEIGPWRRLSAHGLTRDDRCCRPKRRCRFDFIQPSSILSRGRGAVLRVSPSQDQVTRGQVKRLTLPVHFSGNARPLHSVDDKQQHVMVGSRGNLPPEAQSRRPFHGGFQPGGLIVGDAAARRLEDAETAGGSVIGEDVQ